jgi:hypothetical protein
LELTALTKKFFFLFSLNKLGLVLLYHTFFLSLWEIKLFMTQEQFTAITAWQKETFGEATVFSKLEHLKEELEELQIDAAIDGLDKRLEFADCFILLFGAAAADGMSFEDVVSCIDEKFEIVKNRKWGEPDENGVVRHIK